VREGYVLLSTCRYIIDPLSYAPDKVAVNDAAIVQSLFDIPMEQLQVLINEVRVILDNIVTNSYRLDIAVAKKFFKTLENFPDTIISEKSLNLF